MFKNFMNSSVSDDFEEDDKENDDEYEYDLFATTKSRVVEKTTEKPRHAQVIGSPLTPEINQMLNEGFTNFYSALRAGLNKLIELIQHVVATVQRWFAS